jgi:L-ascorbate metabolism protein UlaG (beta-lactamase superfamily)
VKIKWLGHAAFLITSDSGTRLVCDPYSVGGGINYNPIDVSADIVTVSHQHGDHNDVAAVKGSPTIVDSPGTGTASGVEFHGVASFHDKSGGKERGTNVIFCFRIDGVRVCHLGDLGHPLEKGQVTEIGSVDIVLVPVGGFYTIDAREATKVCDQLKPRIVIPMHFKVKQCSYPIAGIDEFLKNQKNVKRVGSSEIEIKKESLPVESETVVLEHAL